MSIVRSRRACLWFAWPILAAGCIITDGGGDDNNNDNGGGGGGANSITIRLINTTSVTLDPEIYLTTDAITDPDQLFTADRKYTSFGVGGRGLLADFDSDSFTLACTAVRVIGTRGGLFGDDLNNPDGAGQQRILAQDAGFVCGDVITLTYSRSGGEYTTSISVSR
ncbi:MAG: hypothetical protein CHACPFDD_01679 [Phycisphaerae bacterium]|nr:hypothetical protein [Phycisphaerae bacterium]